MKVINIIKNMNSIWIIPAILLAVFLFTASAACHGGIEDPLTTEERAWLNENDGKIRLGPDPNAPPLDFFDEFGQYKGLTADYVRLIEKKLGFRFEIVRMDTWDDLLTSAKKKEIDVVCAAKWTPERDKYLLFTKPFIHIPEVIITRKSFKESVSIEELLNIKVTMVEGYAVLEIVSKKYPWLDIETSKSDLDGLLKVSFNRCDAMIIDLTMASYLIEKEGIENLRVAGFSDIIIDLGFASRRDLPILNSILEKGLALITEQERNSIYSTWIHLEVKHFYASRRFWLIISGVLGIPAIAIVIILVWNRTLRHLVEQRTAKLEESNALLRAGEKQIHKLSHAVKYSSATIVITDTEGNIEYTNPTFAHLTGYSIEEAIGNNSRILQSGETRPEVYEELWSTIKSGDEWKGELCNKKKDGELYWEHVSISPVKDDNGAITNFIAVKDDITGRKQAEEALKLSEQRLRDILNYSSAIFYMKDLSGKYLFINQRYELIFNIKNKDIINKTDHDIFPKEMADTYRSHDIQVVEKCGHVEVEESALHDDGNVHTYISVKFPVRRASGEIYATCGISTDITKRKKLEVELQKLASVVRNCSELINIATTDGKMIFLNDAGSKMLGIDSQQVEHVTIMEVIPDHLKDLVQNELHPKLRNGHTWQGELQYRNLKTDKLTDVYATIFPIIDQDSNKPIYFANVSLDITGRKQAEDALRETTALLSNVINSSTDMIFVKDMELRTIMCNKVFATAVGKNPEDLIGKTDIENGWNPELVHGNPEKGVRGFESDDREALSGRVVHNPADLANVGDKILVFEILYPQPIGNE